MKIQINGTEELEVDSIKIIWSDEVILDADSDNLDITGTLVLTGTHEGIILDVINEKGESEITAGLMVSDLTELCH